MAEKHYYFHAVDYVVFISMLCVSAGIGVYYACTGGKQKTTSEYLMGDRKMGIFPIAMSLMASITSSVIMVGLPSEVYRYGIYYYYRRMGQILSIPVLVYAIIPVFYKLRLVSVNEYIELRFNRVFRYVASMLFIIAMIVYAAFAIYAPAICLRQVTGINLWWSVIAVGAVGTFYTAIGGIKAVMWTDVVQGAVMTIAMTAICVKGTVDIGGFVEVIERNYNGQRIGSLSFSLDPRIRYTFWTCTISPLLFYLIFGVNQTQVQRFLSAPTLKNAQKSVWWNIPGMAIFNTLCGYVGLILYAKYWKCDPLASNKLDKQDQIVPFLIIDSTSEYPGFAGLFVAGIYSGSLSTISSLFNSLSAVVVEDFIRKTNRWKSVNEKQAAKISKLIVVLFGLLSIILASCGDYLGTIIQSVAYNLQIFIATLFGIFALGLFFPWTTSLGSAIGVGFGMAFGFWISIGSQLNRYVHPRLPISLENCSSVNISSNYTGPITDENVFDLYKISFAWMPDFIVLSTMIIGLVASFITGANDVNSVDPRLLSPFTKVILRKVYGNKFRGYVKSRNNSALKVFLAVTNENQVASSVFTPDKQDQPVTGAML